MSSGEDLWSFIKNSKATKSASFKVLQKFILSLNKKELKHLIETYLKSKLSKRKHDKTVSYTKTTTNRLLNANNDTTLNVIDKQILSKLNRKYGNKYNKKVVKKIQQNCESKQNKNLLSIHPQVLAYSFQYLSYKELCKTQHTCVYFTYLNKQYPALTHYYLKFDKTLFLNVVKNKINFNFLSHYKHIDLRYSDDTKSRHSQLFKHILKTIISQSISNLSTLQLQIPYHHGAYTNYTLRNAAPFNLLLYIMEQFPSLPITNLIWDTDIFKPSQNYTAKQVMQQVKARLFSRAQFPQLKHFQFGITAFPQSIIVPVINNYAQLQSLTITNRLRWDVLQDTLIPLICSKLKELKALSVSCPAIATLTKKVDTIVYRCFSVQELNVTLVSNANTLPKCSCQHMLTKLLLCFLGIKTFTFDGYSLGLRIDWQAVFRCLLLNKRIYCLEIDNERVPLSPLRSLTFKSMSYGNSINILKSLTNLKHAYETRFDLNSFHIQTRFPWHSIQADQDLLAAFVDHFIRFIKSAEDNFKLSSINVSFGRRRRCVIREGYFEPVLKLLDNIPKSLNSITFSGPLQYIATSREELLKIKETESTKVAKKLSLISAENTGDTKLELIALENVEFSSKSKRFLQFYFGYNNKLIVEDDKYYFKFV